jgi:glycosyltransferase involved in cell wall biosynthesis
MPLKILLISRCAWTLYNFRAGLIAELVDRGHTVVCAGRADGFEERIRAAGAEFSALPVSGQGISPAGDLKLLLAIYRLIRQTKPDIVHLFTIKPVIYGAVAAKLAGAKKIISTVTGLGFVFTREKGSWLRLLVETMYRVALLFPETVFFLNPQDRAVFVDSKLVSPSKALLLPGEGVDCSHFAPVPLPEGEKPYTVLMIARLLKDKGVLEFAGAARLVRQKAPDARFLLLGPVDTHNPSALNEQEIAAMQQDGAVELLGRTDDVRPFIADADVIALPSYREGLPRVLLEAGAMERPVVAADVEGCRDVVVAGATGLLVPKKDEKALAEAFLELMDNAPLRRAMGKAGRELVLDRFDEKAVCAAIIRQYEDKPRPLKAKEKRPEPPQ